MENENVNTAVEATEQEVTPTRRGKAPTKAQINSTEELVGFVQAETANGTPEEEITARVREVISAQFTAQKALIEDAVFSSAVAPATPAKQEWLKTRVIMKIRNARKPKF